MTGGLVKGALVDVPAVMADGLHNVPKLYGEKVEPRAPITDWKRGHIVAGKVCAIPLTWLPASQPARQPPPATVSTLGGVAFLIDVNLY